MVGSVAKTRPSPVSVANAGHLLGVSRSTIWRMIRRGDLATVRQGGRRLVLADASRVASIRTRRGSVPPLSKDHPIFRLVGAGRSGGNPPGARDKHAILER